MITGLSRHLTAQLSPIQVKAMTQHFIIFAFFAPNFRLEESWLWLWAREAQTEQQQVDDLN